MSDSASGQSMNGASDAPEQVMERLRSQLGVEDAAAVSATLEALARNRSASVDVLREAAKLAHAQGLQSESTAAFVAAGSSLAADGDFDGAKARYQALLDVDAKNVDALFGLACVDNAQGNTKDAKAKLLDVLRASNLKHLPALFEAGKLYQSEGDYDSAILAFKRILDRDKQHVGALERLGDLHHERRMQPEALDYLFKASEAAQSKGMDADAQRIVNTILSIDPSSGKGRAQLDKLSKAQAAKAAAKAPAAPDATAAQPAQAKPAPAAAAKPDRPAPPPPAPAPVAAPAGKPADAKPEAAKPAAAAPARSDDSSTEVALMEQQSKLTADLARVTAAVTQAVKKRLAVEEELRSAQSVLESMRSQGVALEDSLTELRTQLEETLRAKESEDRSLSELSEKRKAALAELSDLTGFVGAAESAQAAAQALAPRIADAKSMLAATETNVSGVVAATRTAETAIAGLQERVATAKQTIDALDKQLSGILEETKAVSAAAQGVVTKMPDINASVSAAETKHAEVTAAAAELIELGNVLRDKLKEAGAAIEHVDALIAERRKQSDSLDQQKLAVDALLENAAAQREHAEMQAQSPVAVDAAAAVALVPPPEATPSAEPPAQESQADAVCPGARETIARCAAEGALPADAADKLNSLLNAGKAADAVSFARQKAGGRHGATFLLIAADVLAENGDVGAAKDLLGQALKAKGVDVVTRYRLALSLQNAGRADEALRLAQALEKDADGLVLGLNAAGRSLRMQGKDDEAAERLSKALESSGFPDWQYHETLFNLGELHEGKEDEEAREMALLAFEELQSGDPNYRNVAQRIEALKHKMNGPAVAGAQ